MKKITLRRRITKPAENPQPRARHTLSLSHSLSHLFQYHRHNQSHQHTCRSYLLWYSNMVQHTQIQTHTPRFLPFTHNSIHSLTLYASLVCLNTHSQNKGCVCKGCACVFCVCCARVLCASVVCGCCGHVSATLSWLRFQSGNHIFLADVRQR